MYLFYNYEALVDRNGILLKYPLTLFDHKYFFPIELMIGGIGIILLLEATRRAIGIPLGIVGGALVGCQLDGG